MLGGKASGAGRTRAGEEGREGERERGGKVQKAARSTPSVAVNGSEGDV